MISCVCVCVRSITTVDTCKTDSCARTRLRARSAMASSELSVRSNMWLLRALSIHCCCLENQAQISFTDRSAVSIFCVSKADGAGHRSWQHSPLLSLPSSLPPMSRNCAKQWWEGGEERERERERERESGLFKRKPTAARSRPRNGGVLPARFAPLTSSLLLMPPTFTSN